MCHTPLFLLRFFGLPFTSGKSAEASDLDRWFEGTFPKTHCVGTLKLGYPLLLYKDAVPTRLSLSRVVKVLCVGPSYDSPRPRVTTLGPQQRLTPPHGRVWSRHVSRVSDILQDINGEPGPPWEGAGPLDIQSRPPKLVQDLHVCKPDPWNGIRTPPRMGSGPPTMGSQGLRTKHTRALNRTQAEVQCRHVSGPSLVGSGPVRRYSYSPFRRRPDATMWHTARGLSQRAEPSMTPLGYARLCIHYG
jgi:hypothetical protein